MLKKPSLTSLIWKGNIRFLRNWNKLSDTSQEYFFLLFKEKYIYKCYNLGYVKCFLNQAKIIAILISSRSMCNPLGCPSYTLYLHSALSTLKKVSYVVLQSPNINILEYMHQN